MLDTIGLDDWNINYVKDNVLKEVEHRIDNMGDLDGIKEALNAGLWKENRAVISDNCAKFADMVKSEI